MLQGPGLLSPHLPWAAHGGVTSYLSTPCPALCPNPSSSAALALGHADLE